MTNYLSPTLSRWVQTPEGVWTFQVEDRNPAVRDSSPSRFREIAPGREVWNNITTTPTLAYTTQLDDGEARYDLVGGVLKASDMTGGQVIPPDPPVVLVMVEAVEVTFDSMMASDSERYFDLPTYYEKVNESDPDKEPGASYVMSSSEWNNGMKRWLTRDRTAEGYPSGYFTVQQLVEAGGFQDEAEMDAWVTSHTMEQVVRALTNRWDELV